MKRRSTDRPLWICPRCRRRFANRNQSHACGRYDLAHHFRGKDPVVRMSFAQVTPHKRWLDGHVVLARRLPHPRFRRIDTISPRNHVHHFRLDSLAEVDAEFRA